jgi:hypothetical protein
MPITSPSSLSFLFLFNYGTTPRRRTREAAGKWQWEKRKKCSQPFCYLPFLFVSSSLHVVVALLCQLDGPLCTFSILVLAYISNVAAALVLFFIFLPFPGELSWADWDLSPQTTHNHTHAHTQCCLYTKMKSKMSCWPPKTPIFSLADCLWAWTVWCLTTRHIFPSTDVHWNDFESVLNVTRRGCGWKLGLS